MLQCQPPSELCPPGKSSLSSWGKPSCQHAMFCCGLCYRVKSVNLSVCDALPCLVRPPGDLHHLLMTIDVNGYIPAWNYYLVSQSVQYFNIPWAIAGKTICITRPADPVPIVLSYAGIMSPKHRKKLPLLKRQYYICWKKVSFVFAQISSACNTIMHCPNPQHSMCGIK